jgi:hypothetical protein
MRSSFAGFEPGGRKNGWTLTDRPCTFRCSMALYTAHVDVRMPVGTGTTSWFEADRQRSLMALINQPSGY